MKIGFKSQIFQIVLSISGHVDHELFTFGQGVNNITIQVGSTAFLHCPVNNLNEREVINYIYYLTSMDN